MSRPTVSIDRLAPRRVTVEPRESMNCKSCRRRKIKCNRLRPSCEACKVFQCPCIYDAVPKKRGPKTDVLEALLERVDGLEKRLQDKKNPISPTSPDKNELPVTPRDARSNSIDDTAHSSTHDYSHPASISFHQYPEPSPRSTGHRPSSSFPSQSSQPNGILSDAILDAYFARLHGKPFFVLEESMTRHRHRLGQLPPPLSMAISAITPRYTSPAGQTEQSLRAGLDAALQARRMVDMDGPCIESLQTLVLLSQAFFAHGLGKKAYMTLSNCVGMVVALDLYREVPSKANLPPAEREMRRRLFWTVYLMDRFINCGSRRPGLISDHSIVLRLPSWSPHAAGLNMEGELFNVGPNVQLSADSRRKSPSAASLLIDITRILGVTDRYLAAGGVKGDSHFPWHALSNLSKIRQELDIWAAGTQDVFASVDTLFGHPESTTLLLSKLIYHLVHCLIYRPFLPIDLDELRGTSQHQSWQIKATNLCFSHSNAIAELVELGRNSSLVEWPAFVGYCVCIAGTVHIHGVHYKGCDGEVFSSSAEFLTREMHQLAWLCSTWAGLQHQRALLQTVYSCHSELVRTLASGPKRFSPVFHLEHFLDRYPGLTLDGAHVQLVDTGDEPAVSAFNLLDEQGYYHQRPMAPSYQIFYSTTHQTPLPPSLSTQSPESRQNAQSQFLAPKQTSSRPPISPAMNFQQAPSNPSQPNPSLSPMFSMSGAAALSPGGSSAAPTENNHLSPPNTFTPSVFGPSPPAFLSESTLNVTPTQPSNPQYATFPFATVHANIGGATQSALTPGAQSQTSGSLTAGSETGAEKDPFLSLLEQLAENEHSQGGPSELDFYLAGTERELSPDQEKGGGA